LIIVRKAFGIAVYILHSSFGFGFSDFAVQADDFGAFGHSALFNTLFG
jgi:hypothetical protein